MHKIYAAWLKSIKRICSIQRLPVDSPVVDINAWIKQHIKWCNARDEYLITAAYGLIKKRDSLERSLAVAKILSELGVDTNLVVAGFVYEPFCRKEINILMLRTILGDTVNKLILDLQKIDLILRSFLSKNYQHKTLKRDFHKILLMSMENIQIIVIKIAIHICAMRMSNCADEKTKIDLVRQAQNIYAPLAKRLHINRLNWELEDLTFKLLRPNLYREIAKRLDERRSDREKYIMEAKRQIAERLKLHGIDGKIVGRPKHIYSIWSKMQRKMVDYSEIYDLHAIRIIVPSIIDCYVALEIVHSYWQHIDKKFDDYISNPKDNGYKSLHTTICGPYDKTLEIQFRTKQMDHQAEFGAAAHWLYKNANISYIE